MSRPTILIGIGSGGLRSIEAAWKYSQEIPAPNRPLVQYIYLETDGSNRPISEEIVSCPLTIDNIAASQNAIIQDIAATGTWVQNQKFPENVLSGAGGSPVLGRMTLWDKPNRTHFSTALNNAIAKFTTQQISTPLVYVVGSLGGGTGSGTFLDVAYIVRDALANQVEMQGLFLIPNVGLSDKVIYSNTVCSLKELNYYNDENHAFPFKWNANPPKGYEAQNSPFDLVQVISAAYDKNLAVVNYSQLHEEAGLFLYLNTLGLYDVRRKSLVDASGNIIVSKYTTFGLSGLHYPESEIRELLGNKFGAEMLGRIVNDQKYYDKNTNSEKPLASAIAVIKNSVLQSFEEQFTSILENWCNVVEIVDQGGSPLPVESHIESLAEKMASGNYSHDEKRKTLYRYFKVGGDYHKQLRNQCDASALNSLVNLITDIVREAFREYHNIYLAKESLASVEYSMDQILKFWQANGYLKDPDSWNKLLQKGIVEEILPMPWTYKLQMEPKNVYKDRIKFKLLYGLGMHVFAETLEKALRALRGDIDTSGNRITVKNSKGEFLPSKYQLDAWTDIISHVTSDSNSNYKSCRQIEQSLRKKLSNSSNGNIEYIYPDGTLDATLQKVEGNYITQNGQERTIQDVAGSDDLYQFLLTIKPNLRAGFYDSELDLYSKVVNAYMESINMGTFSVAEAVQDGTQSQKVQLVTGKAKIAHVPVNPTGRNAEFLEHKNIPYVLSGFDGSAGTVLDQIDSQLRGMNIQGFEIRDKDRNKLSHIGLNNWLIFYKEFGRMTDDKPFNIIDDLCDFENYSVNYYADMQSSGLTGKQYHEKRMPYISYEECRAQSQAYINEGSKYYQEEELEKAVRSYKYAQYWDMGNPMPGNRMADIQGKLNSESTSQKYDRFLNVANSYFKKQDYPTARYYYQMAYKLVPGDGYITAQCNQIDQIALQVTKLVAQADQMSIDANANYDQCVQNRDISLRPTCIQQLNSVLEIYKKAEELSRFDEVVKHKISSVERRINNLNNI